MHSILKVPSPASGRQGHGGPIRGPKGPRGSSDMLPKVPHSALPAGGRPAERFTGSRTLAPVRESGSDDQEEA